MGDVNYDWVSTTAKGVKTKDVELIYNIENSYRVQNPIRVKVTANNFKELTALQYTLNFNNEAFEFVGIENNKLGIEFNSKQAASTGNISFLWADASSEPKSVEDGSELFTLVLKKKGIGYWELGIGEIINNLQLTISNAITEIEAWDNNFKQHNIILTKQTINDKPQTTNDLFSVYPNPATNLANIECSNAKQLVIVNALGKTTQQLKVTSEQLKVDVSKFAKGIYVLQILFKDGAVKNEKLIVE